MQTVLERQGEQFVIDALSQIVTAITACLRAYDASSNLVPVAGCSSCHVLPVFSCAPSIEPVLTRCENLNGAAVPGAGACISAGQRDVPLFVKFP